MRPDEYREQEDFHNGDTGARGAERSTFPQRPAADHGHLGVSDNKGRPRAELRADRLDHLRLPDCSVDIPASRRHGVRQASLQGQPGDSDHLHADRDSPARAGSEPRRHLSRRIHDRYRLVYNTPGGLAHNFARLRRETRPRAVDIPGRRELRRSGGTAHNSDNRSPLRTQPLPVVRDSLGRFIRRDRIYQPLVQPLSRYPRT